MARYFISLGLLFCADDNDLFAQTTTIQLDRPDQTECPFIVPKNYIQVENGFTYESVANGLQNFSHPSTLWKYGVNGNVELRLITELITEKDHDQRISGLLPVTLGFKAKLFEEKGILPMTSFIGHITSASFGSKGFHTTYIAPSFRFTMQHSLSERVSLAYNLGVEWNGETSEQTYIYTLTTGISITEQLGSYVELYGFAPAKSKTDHRFDCGLTYLLNNDFMVDLSGGIGITKNAPDHFVSLGVSYRFSVKKKELQ